MALFLFFRGLGGGGRWLMYEEMLASFILSFGSPGQESGLSGLSGLGAVWQVQESLCSGWVLCGQCRSPFVCCKGIGGGFRWLMFEKVSGAFMALIFSP